MSDDITEPRLAARGDDADSDAVEAFIERWRTSGASEQANYQLFLAELARLLGVEEPRPATDRASANDYCFERRVDQPGGTPGFIDLYKEGCFVLEAKQGSDAVELTEAEALAGEGGALRRKMGTARRSTRGWEQAMQRAKRQARRYARALPEKDGWPPFLVVVDVGYCIDLYADFARQGKTYVQFPGPDAYRIRLEDLRDPAARERLRKVWTDPLALDPARRSARVTRELAEKLGRLASALEGEGGHDTGRVAGFLMRSLFTMFAEDAGLIPEGGFTKLLAEYRGEDLEMLPQALAHLWETMNKGGFSPALRAEVRRFNGALFSEAEALPLTEAQRALLAEAAAADWSEVEPAIFGTLLERALDPRERHRLGAHYTPRAYVERLVQPTVVEPLRAEWEAAQAAAASRETEGDEAGAVEEIRAFHERLCTARVLDPACGSGNFLYVTLEHLKRLEAEVLQALGSYGASTGLDMTGGYRVSPEQLLGLEVNPRAARIADVVLWIGYLQWHLRTHGSADRLDEPILRAYGNIEERDALITYDERRARTGEDGEAVMRWDRRTMKKHPTTGEMVPDESAREPVYDYENPEMAEWPEADFIVGNPPFVGSQMMRDALGEGYAEAVREAYYRRVPQSADFVMFWWYKAAGLVRKARPERFGFITTNTVRQTFNRRVIDKQMGYKNAVHLAFAIPDHPWVDGASGADVRIAMTVGTGEDVRGTLQTVAREEKAEGMHRTVKLEEKRGTILSDLTIGADVAGAEALEANEDLSFMGVKLVGDFTVTQKEAEALGLGEKEGIERHLPRFRNGRDLTQHVRGVRVVDLYGLEKEEARKRFPALYQRLKERVEPVRAQNKRKTYRERWWTFAEPRSRFREAREGLSRYIATSEVSKHRFFRFLDSGVLPDGALIAIASEDDYHFGVLSSRIHETWALAAGGRMGVGNDPRYTSSRCFRPFPFPAATREEKDRIRETASALDTHREEQLAEHTDLTMTALYNVLEKERALKQHDPQGAPGEALSENEKEVHRQGLVGVLGELHDELDEAVAAAYGWEAGLAEEEVLERLVALNTKRRAEEEQGRVRWLRPAYQAPEETQGALEMEGGAAGSEEVAEVQPRPWPDELAARVQAVQGVVAASEEALTVEEVAARFRYARRKQVRSILETLEALSQVRRASASEKEDVRFAG